MKTGALLDQEGKGWMLANTRSHTRDDGNVNVKWHPPAAQRKANDAAEAQKLRLDTKKMEHGVARVRVLLPEIGYETLRPRRVSAAERTAVVHATWHCKMFFYHILDLKIRLQRSG